MKLPVVDEAEVRGKKVLVRGDIDVPLKDGVITDTTRLEAAKPTFDYLVQSGAQVTLCGHIGRPEGKVVPELSTKPIQEWLDKTFKQPIKVLENLRFDSREEANEEALAKELANGQDLYVDEAFAACERNHASISGVPKLLPHYAGFRLVKEVEVLENILQNPRRPLLTIIAGAKLETKVPAITQMARISENVIIGGRLIGNYMNGTTEALKKVKVINLTNDGKDASLESVDSYRELIAGAATIVWNGPLGAVEDYTYQIGTRRLAELIVNNEMAYKLIGGGDTVSFIDKLGLTDKFNWVSVGGGSMLKFLSGEKLPGIEALLR